MATQYVWLLARLSLVWMMGVYTVVLSVGHVSALSTESPTAMNFSAPCNVQSYFTDLTSDIAAGLVLRSPTEVSVAGCLGVFQSRTTVVTLAPPTPPNQLGWSDSASGPAGPPPTLTLSTLTNFLDTDPMNQTTFNVPLSPISCASLCALSTDILSVVYVALFQMPTSSPAPTPAPGSASNSTQGSNLRCYCLKQTIEDFLLPPRANLSDVNPQGNTTSSSSGNGQSVSNWFNADAFCGTGSGPIHAPSDIVVPNRTTTPSPYWTQTTGDSRTAFSFPVFRFELLCAPRSRTETLGCGSGCMRSTRTTCCVPANNIDAPSVDMLTILWIVLALAGATITEFCVHISCVLHCRRRRSRNNVPVAGELEMGLLDRGEAILRDTAEAEALADTILKSLRSEAVKPLSTVANPLEATTPVCPFCLELLLGGARSVLQCGHRTHSHCLRTYLTHHIRRHETLVCPICRETIESSSADRASAASSSAAASPAPQPTGGIDQHHSLDSSGSGGMQGRPLQVHGSSSFHSPLQYLGNRF